MAANREKSVLESYGDETPRVAHKSSGVRPLRRRTTERRVLVVDDDIFVSRSIVGILASFEVYALSSPRVALARIADGLRFDIIFCDVVPSEFNGIDLYERLRRLVPTQAMRVVFAPQADISWGSRELIAMAQQPVLLKPFRTESLRLVVNSLIGTVGPLSD